MFNGGSCYGGGASLCFEADRAKLTTMPYIMRVKIPFFTAGWGR